MSILSVGKHSLEDAKIVVVAKKSLHEFSFLQLLVIFWTGFVNFFSFFWMLLNWQTFLSMTWRFFVAVCDWRTHLRVITGRPAIDVVFITNMRDRIDRKKFLGRFRPECGHFNGPRYWFHGISGRTRALDVTARELMNPKIRKEAKKKFLNAVQWAGEHGAKVILLAAGTKRLFGRDGAELKELFPDLIFSIGDNGTALLLKFETLRALRQADLKPADSRIAVLGPYGLLGEQIVIALKQAGYKVVGAGTNDAIRSLAKKHNIEICHTFSDMDQVDAVIACTHSEAICLNADAVESIRHPKKKLLVVDVAEPSNFTKAEYEECKDVVVRQDAGNAYMKGLKYVIGALSYRRFRLTRAVTFGCFAETLALFLELRRGNDIKKVDWFAINETNMAIVEKMFKKEGIVIPSPRCFGKSVRSFNLSINGGED